MIMSRTFDLQREEHAHSAPAGHARPVSDANASTVSAAARAWPVMTARGVRRRQRSARTRSSEGQVEGLLEAERHALGVGALQLLIA
jgi:hypothetical protein